MFTPKQAIDIWDDQPRLVMEALERDIDAFLRVKARDGIWPALYSFGYVMIRDDAGNTREPSRHLIDLAIPEIERLYRAAGWRLVLECDRDEDGGHETYIRFHRPTEAP